MFDIRLGIAEGPTAFLTSTGAHQPEVEVFHLESPVGQAV